MKPSQILKSALNKQADARMQGIVEQLDFPTNFRNNFPLAQYGAGAGALLGAGSALFSDREDKLRTALRRGLGGGLLGGAAGLGLGAADAFYEKAQGREGFKSYMRDTTAPLWSDPGTLRASLLAEAGKADIEGRWNLGDNPAESYVKGLDALGLRRLIENRVDGYSDDVLGGLFEGDVPDKSEIRFMPNVYDLLELADAAKQR